VDELDRSVRRPDQLQRWAEAWHALTDDVGIMGLYLTPTPYVVRRGITGAIPSVVTGAASWAPQLWDMN
jgi:hypothetical protein